jgi:hypothetical protein
MADTLAKEAAQDEDEQNIIYNKISTTSAAAELKKCGDFVFTTPCQRVYIVVNSNL